MATSKPGDTNRGWNDPPMYNYSPSQPSPRRTPLKLNKRVAFPLSLDTNKLQQDNVALLNPENGPPLSPVKLLPPAIDTTTPTPVPLLIPLLAQTSPPPANSPPQDSAQQLLALETCQGKNGEIGKRLVMLKESWQKDQLSDEVKIKLYYLIEALSNHKYDKAHEIHLSLIVDHISQVNQWIVGIKRLIQEMKCSTEPDSQECSDGQSEHSLNCVKETVNTTNALDPVNDSGVQATVSTSSVTKPEVDQSPQSATEL
ncbi:hypothetical protein ScPMuIL_010195 [Solemya velum]